MSGRGARASRGVVGVVGLLALVTLAGCATLMSPRVPRGRTEADPAAIVDALATRERALPGLRLSMSARATGVAGWLLASPTYLAIDDGDRLHLQVLAPFGATVFDLTTSGADYDARWPMRGGARQGRIDPAALAAATTPPDERLIVALALLFRPKTTPGPCEPAGGNAVRCHVTPEVTTTIQVDALLRPTEERYGLADGDTPLWTVVYDDYPSPDPAALPGRITIRDPESDTAMIVRVLKVQRAGEAPALSS